MTRKLDASKQLHSTSWLALSGSKLGLGLTTKLGTMLGFVAINNTYLREQNSKET